LDALHFYSMNVPDIQKPVIGPLLAGPPKELLSSTTFLLKRLGFAATNEMRFQGPLGGGRRP